MFDKKEIQVVGAVYSLDTGRIEWLSSTNEPTSARR